MDDFEFSLPTKIYFGKSALDNVGRECRLLSRRVLLHYGGAHAVKSGLVARLRAQLEDSGIEVTELGGVQPNPRLSLCREGIRLCRENKIDMVLAVGGGSVMDSAKCIAVGTTDDGDVWDFFTHARVIAGRPLPVGAIVTLPASGSENNGIAVISDTGSGQKLPIMSPLIVPAFAILDPTLTYSLPAWQTACGAIDTIAHMVLGYFTKQPVNEFVFSQIEAAVRCVLHFVPRALEKPDDYEARAQLMWASTVGLNGSLSVGCDKDNASHRIEHEWGALYDITHGAGIGVAMLGWMRYILPHAPARFARFAENVFGITGEDDAAAGAAGIDALEDRMKAAGLPVRIDELGIDAGCIVPVARTIAARDGAMGCIVPLGEADLLAVQRLCL